jgi:hypothetical protein
MTPGLGIRNTQGLVTEEKWEGGILLGRQGHSTIGKQDKLIRTDRCAFGQRESEEVSGMECGATAAERWQVGSMKRLKVYTSVPKWQVMMKRIKEKRIQVEGREFNEREDAESVKMRTAAIWEAQETMERRVDGRSNPSIFLA